MRCKESVSQAPARLILLMDVIDHRQQKAIHLACYKMGAQNIPEKTIEAINNRAAYG